MEQNFASDLRVVFINDAGGVSILIPTTNCGLTVQEIALKDVPTGRPFKIVHHSEIPTDRTERADWFVEATDLTDGVGA